MHKLKMKYRDMSSEYTENLMKPLFKSNQRSYKFLPTDPELLLKQTQSEHQSEIAIHEIINSADRPISTNIVSPSIDFNVHNIETAENPNADGEISELSPGFLDQKRGKDMNTTFHSQMGQQTLNPQYQKKGAGLDLYNSNSIGKDTKEQNTRA